MGQKQSIAKKLIRFSLPIILFVLQFLISFDLEAQSITPWRMNRGAAGFALPPACLPMPYHGAPCPYNYAAIPPVLDPGWSAAPLNGLGQVSFSEGSFLPNGSCLLWADFTYFETQVTLPANFIISTFTVSFSQVDDGARAYIFNSAHPTGAFVAGGDLIIGGPPVTANLASLAVVGEVNRIVIVQYDDCPVANNLIGAQVNVNGQIVLSINCPQNITVNNDPNQCGANATYPPATASGGTPPININYSNASGSFFPIGTTTVTATATGAGNGIATCTFTVTVNDNQPPSISCPPNITLPCGSPIPNPDIASVSASDNCPGVTVNWVGDVSSNSLCPGSFTITRTYRATDASNNSATCTQTITVVDNTPPTLTVPANATLQCSDPLPLMPLNINSSPNFIEGTYNVGTAVFGAPLTATPLTADAVMVIDDAGNPYDACENITNDLTGKIAVIERSGCTPPASFFVTKAYKAQLAGAVGVIFIFNQPGNNVVTMGLPPGPNPTITIPLMLVSNNYGNTLKAEILAGAVNVSLSAPTVFANDECSFAAITHQQTFTPGNCPSSFNLVNTWTATDQCGNATTASQTITFIDNTAPTITVPANITLQCSDPLPLMPVNINSSPNNMDGTYTFGTAVFGAPLSNTAVTGNLALVNDGFGNTADACQAVTNNLTGKIAVVDRGSCLFTLKVLAAQNAGAIGVIVVNNQPGNNILTMGGAEPLITIPSILVSNNYGNALKASMALGTVNASLSASPIIAADNCSGVTITYTKVITPGSCANSYSILNTWTATDACNNATSASQTITVIDNTNPVISVQNIARCFADDNFGCSINLGATATDNCGLLSLTSNAPVCFPVGTTTVTWTATDECGNVTTATQTVTRNPEININVCAGPTRTIYTGTTSGVGPFGPHTVNLSSVVTGGTPGYSYKWTPSTGLNNALIANPIASPAVTTTYTLTVTDSRGCKRSLSITINVLPLSAAVCSGSGNNVKFLVCHIPPGNASNPQNICISANALNAHLTIGSKGHNNCYLGPCQQNCVSTVPGAVSLITSNQPVTDQIVTKEPDEVEQPDFKVNVFPNPAAFEFSIQVLSKSNEPVIVRIMDLNGKVRSVQTQLSKNSIIKVGSRLLSGTYFAEVTQGSNKQLVKLVKLN